MDKTITIIELLNKIADGEEVPENIVYNGKIYKFDEKFGWYFDEFKSANWYIKADKLNTTIKILEDEESIDIDNIKELEYVEDYEVDKTDVRLNRDKINELIKAVKQLNNKIKEN